MILEDILTWCLLSLALAGLASFAPAMHGGFLRRKRRKQSNNMATKIAASCATEPQPDRPASRPPIVRGYDSPELYRQDWSLLRIEQSRKQFAGVETSLQLFGLSAGTREEYEKRVCAVLAQHASGRRDN